MFDQYDLAYPTYEKLVEKNEILKARQGSLAGVMSKQKVQSVLGQKANQADKDSKETAKKFTNGSMDLQSFLNDFLTQRKEYHTHQMLKIKVG